ncbi:MAG TPA: efflux RND transporter periplasmic adaptor subunit [Methylophaga sp.]|nr:efflux RND transporter periplasmic adaptor subunit [Methylophaga sp.]
MKAYPFLFVLALILSPAIYAAGGHDHDSAETSAVEGPHGGRLLQADDFALEITIYEQGVPPEMRVYTYQKDQLLDPQDINLTVTLNRLGGQQDLIDFSPEQDYLLGDTVITEPHSYELEIAASYQGKDYHWHIKSFEGRATLTSRIIEASDIQTGIAGPQTLNITNSLYGVIAPAEDRQFRVYAPYPGIVEAVYVNTGDNVKKGQRLLTVRNQQTLRSYDIKSPASGEVTKRLVKAGDHSDIGNLMEISDFSKVWVDMSMFPQDIEQLQEGMAVTIIDLHGHEKASGEISYISPKMTGGHIARARTVIDNPEGYWRPGMHINAEVTVDKVDVELAVKRSALQSFRDMPVVFARYGNTFEVRMVEEGRRDKTYVEVKSGLKPGTEYVTGNSFLLKAEVLKDGASHSH